MFSLLMNPAAKAPDSPESLEDSQRSAWGASRPLSATLASQASGDGPGIDVNRDVGALRPLVRGVIAKVMGRAATDADLDDGAHETLRRALEGSSRLRPGEPLRAWVVGIAKHVALNQLRAQKRGRERFGESPGLPGGDESEAGTSAIDRVADASPDAHAVLEQAQRIDAVRDVLRTLPDGARDALTLFHLEGLGYQEIAVRLDVPLGTVATWVSRGRKAMATVMMKDARQP